MTEADTDERRTELAERYRTVRALTESLSAPLSPEDQTVQSMPDASPTKWHRGHTSWFFETFLLVPELPGYRVVDDSYAYIFNSYYEAVGARHPRAERGLISRPGVDDVARYRRHVDEAMAELLRRAPTGGGPDGGPDALGLVDLGLHHEQQHQELLLMDIKHVLSRNPRHPAYDPAAARGRAAEAAKPGWVEHPGGPVEIGHAGGGFAFDNESPRHVVQLVPHALCDRLVTCGEWMDFIDDGGYRRPELWLSDGWATVNEHGWVAPLYWSRPAGDAGEGWRVFTLGGERAVRRTDPVCHVSYYEADAFAHWTGYRLPSEAEWEAAAAGTPVGGDFLDQAALHPTAPSPGDAQLFGSVWEWTASQYTAYPGFKPAEGALGEYNGKFMCNQFVLRGGSCATPQSHIRASYRNFFPPQARWQFSGIRLAKDGN